MRILLLVLLLFFAVFRAHAGDVALVIDHRMQGEKLRSGEVYAMGNATWYFAPRFLKYYLAEITVVHDGGKRTPLPYVYVLVDALGQDRYVLGSYDVSQVEALEFHVGVDKRVNHEDPTIYPPEHPLALKNPTMHWGWAAGYRFIAVEGSAGTSPNVVAADVQVHTVGNELYRKITMPVRSTQTPSGVDIQLTAEYSALFNNLDVAYGLIFHGLGEETIIMSDNMASRVFSSPLTSVDDVGNSHPLSVWPLPTSGGLTVVSELEAPVRAILVNGLGSSSELSVSGSTRNTWDLSAVAAGTYTLVVTTASGTTHHAPVVILR